MKAPVVIALATLGWLAGPGAARADLIGAEVDVTFMSTTGHIDANLGSVTIGFAGTEDATPYGLLTFTPDSIAIAPPSGDRSFSYAGASGFSGFLFTYNASATVGNVAVESATVDPASGLTPTGLVANDRQVSVNLLGETLYAGAPMILDVAGTGTPLAMRSQESVPEPGSAVLLATGLAGLAARRRRRRAGGG